MSKDNEITIDIEGFLQGEEISQVPVISTLYELIDNAIDAIKKRNMNINTLKIQFCLVKVSDLSEEGFMKGVTKKFGSDYILVLVIKGYYLNKDEIKGLTKVARFHKNDGGSLIGLCGRGFTNSRTKLTGLNNTTIIITNKALSNEQINDTTKREEGDLKSLSLTGKNFKYNDDRSLNNKESFVLKYARDNLDYDINKEGSIFVFPLIKKVISEMEDLFNGTTDQNLLSSLFVKYSKYIDEGLVLKVTDKVVPKNNICDLENTRQLNVSSTVYIINNDDDDDGNSKMTTIIDLIKKGYEESKLNIPKWIACPKNVVNCLIDSNSTWYVLYKKNDGKVKHFKINKKINKKIKNESKYKEILKDKDTIPLKVRSNYRGRKGEGYDYNNNKMMVCENAKFKSILKNLNVNSTNINKTNTRSILLGEYIVRSGVKILINGLRDQYKKKIGNTHRNTFTVYYSEVVITTSKEGELIDSYMGVNSQKDNILFETMSDCIKCPLLFITTNLHKVRLNAQKKNDWGVSFKQEQDKEDEKIKADSKKALEEEEKEEEVEEVEEEEEEEKKEEEVEEVEEEEEEEKKEEEVEEVEVEEVEKKEEEVKKVNTCDLSNITLEKRTRNGSNANLPISLKKVYECLEQIQRTDINEKQEHVLIYGTDKLKGLQDIGKEYIMNSKKYATAYRNVLEYRDSRKSDVQNFIGDLLCEYKTDITRDGDHSKALGGSHLVALVKHVNEMHENDD